MEALVVRGVGEVDFRWVQTDSYGIPPRHFLFYRIPRNSADFFEPRSAKESIVMPLSITRLPIHRLAGLPVPFAYWPDNWLDEWGLKEVCKYFDIEIMEENYGAAGYFVAGVATDLVVRPSMRMDVQWPEASS